MMNKTPTFREKNYKHSNENILIPKNNSNPRYAFNFCRTRFVGTLKLSVKFPITSAGRESLSHAEVNDDESKFEG